MGVSALLTAPCTIADNSSPLYRGHLARPLDSGTTARNDSAKQAGNKMDADSMTPEDREIVKRVEELAKKKDWAMSHVALQVSTLLDLVDILLTWTQWIIQRGTIPIVGFSNVKRLDEACGVTGKTLSDEEMKYLEEPYKPKNIVGHS